MSKEDSAEGAMAPVEVNAEGKTEVELLRECLKE